MTIQTTTKRVAFSGLALAAAVGLAACSTNAKVEVTSDIDATEILHKTVNANSLDKPESLLSADRKVDLALDIDVKVPTMTDAITGKANASLAYDADSKTFEASWDVDIPALTAEVPGFPKQLKAYAQQSSDDTLDAFINYNNMWLKTSLDLDDILGAVEGGVMNTPSISRSDLDEFVTGLDEFADVTTTESATEYHIHAVVKDAAWDELVKGAAEDGLTFDRDSLKGELDLYVDKETYVVKSLSAKVNAVTTDGSVKMVVDAKLTNDTNADVTVTIPAEARDKAIDINSLGN